MVQVAVQEHIARFIRLDLLEKPVRVINQRARQEPTIILDDLPGSAIGMSWQQSAGQYVVALKTVLWSDIPLSMPVTFYHELGHILSGHTVPPGQKSPVPYHREEAEATAPPTTPVRPPQIVTAWLWQ